MKRVVIESPTKTCTRCRVAQPVDHFGSSRNRRDGKHPWCRSCTSISKKELRQQPAFRDRLREYQRLWAQRPKNLAKSRVYQQTEARRATRRRSKLKTKYGLTEAQHDAMIAAQGGVCGACGGGFKSTKHTHTDHCHKTGRVRGVLCHNCNRALGAVKDSPDTMLALIAYLRRSDQCAE